MQIKTYKIFNKFPIFSYHLNYYRQNKKASIIKIDSSQNNWNTSTHNWTVISYIAVPFLWIHVHSVNGHRFSVFNANFDRCPLQNALKHPAKRTKTKTNHTQLHKAPAEVSAFLGYVMYTKQWRNATDKRDTAQRKFSRPTTHGRIENERECFTPTTIRIVSNRKIRWSLIKWRGGAGIHATSDPDVES